MSAENEAAACVSNTAAGDVEASLFSDAIRSLPSHAVKDLLSIGVCVRCIFRLFGIHEQDHFGSSFSLSRMLDNLCEATENQMVHHPNSKGPEDEPHICCVCLGILQFTYLDDKGEVIKKDGVNELAVSIAELVREEGHQFDGFSLEVSIPSLIQDNDSLVQLYMRKKYGSESWFTERISGYISTKDALKSAIATSLEPLFDVKHGPSSCRIRLTYTQTMSPSKTSNSEGRNGMCKRRKTDEGNAVPEQSFSGSNDDESLTALDFPAGRVSQPCQLVFVCYRTPIYFGGRYLKFSRNVSQTRWIIDDERMGEASVEEIIGGSMLSVCQGDIYKFHAAGREDIDVRMLGSGRPFLVEIQNPRQVPSEDLVKDIEKKINNLDGKLIEVKNLKLVDSQGWTLMHEGGAEKQKQYCALVWTSRPLEDEDFSSITSVKDMNILQRTPIRVLHRRSPLEREKIIHWMRIERIAGSTQYFLLHLCTQAGTYIKEFVHGDLGRTHPSIGSMVGCRAEILQLDVTDVKMDCFTDE